jgi:DNA-binding transcriptional regulator YdaS (Cro superfamily)
MVNSQTMKTTDAVHYFGGATALSRALGIRREAIYQWGEDVPVRRAYELERITGGRLKAPVPHNQRESVQ